MWLSRAHGRLPDSERRSKQEHLLAFCIAAAASSRLYLVIPRTYTKVNRSSGTNGLLCVRRPCLLLSYSYRRVCMRTPSTTRTEAGQRTLHCLGSCPGRVKYKIRLNWSSTAPGINCHGCRQASYVPAQACKRADSSTSSVAILLILMLYFRTPTR